MSPLLRRTLLGILGIALGLATSVFVLHRQDIGSPKLTADLFSYYSGGSQAQCENIGNCRWGPDCGPDNVYGNNNACGMAAGGGGTPNYICVCDCPYQKSSPLGNNTSVICSANFNPYFFWQYTNELITCAHTATSDEIAMLQAAGKQVSTSDPQIRVPICDLNRQAYSYNATYNQWSDQLQYVSKIANYGGPNASNLSVMETTVEAMDTICPATAVKTKCASDANGDYTFVPDGGYCQNSDDCYHGHNTHQFPDVITGGSAAGGDGFTYGPAPRDRPYRSDCVPEMTMPMDGAAAGGGGTPVPTGRSICQPVPDRCGDGITQNLATKQDEGSSDLIDEQCDAGTENGKDGVDCTLQCQRKCGNGVKDPDECASATPGKIACPQDVGDACNDGCDNDGDGDVDQFDFGCYEYHQLWERDLWGANNPHPVAKSNYGPFQPESHPENKENPDTNDTTCPAKPDANLDIGVLGQYGLLNGNNMCFPKPDIFACAQTSSSSPAVQFPQYYGAMRWPQIEGCCYQQSTFIVDYLCDNSVKASCGDAVPYPLISSQCWLCGDSSLNNPMRETLRQEFTAECACANGAPLEGGQSGDAKNKAITLMRACEQEQCPTECANNGADKEACATCMGQPRSGSQGETKANYCRLQVEAACVVPPSSTNFCCMNNYPSDAGTCLPLAN